jgi:hypothetical protein
MAVSITRSIAEGFRAANKSWPGIGVIIGIWIALVALTLGGIAVTNPPAELAQLDQGPVEEAAAPATETPAEGAAAAAAPTPEQEERRRVALAWLGRAWPILGILILLYLAAGTWLLGGQIGYLTARVRTQSGGLSEFWAAGARAFWPLLGASGLMVLGLLLAVLIVGAAAALAATAVRWLAAVLIGLLWIGFVWAAVRLAFWLVAVVADRVGPVGGLRASLRATRGHWWRLFGLLALWILISLGAQLPFGVLEWVGQLIGGAVEAVAQAISAVVGGIASVYISFASLAAFIRFYEDTKAATP